jgi:hypothetical protein
MLAWWSVFCSIHQQRQGFRILEGLGLAVRLDQFSDRFSRTGLVDAGLVVGVLLDPFAAAGLIDLGLSVRFARFPVNPESGRSGLGGWRSAQSIRSARASSSLKVSVLPDFRTGSAGQGIIDVGLVVGVLLDL